ncbi:RDD family protein [Nocardia sp. NPDC059177]|uniref:RDD family protein n=1 Tax=Nocardia sp. NPDC059177 TaxID=3346759 RepID=UPI0036819B1C
MNDPGARWREAAALDKRYKRRSDGSRQLGPVLAEDGNPAPRPTSLSARRADGSTPAAAVVFAVLTDWALHLGLGVVACLALRPFGPGMAILYGLLVWIAASFIHRTIVQRLTGATLGYALFGLRLRHPDGSSPSLARLVLRWFSTLGKAVVEVISLP